MSKRPYKKPQPELSDTDKMPFGMHKDKPMSDVPASYFHYLWNSGKSHELKICPVARYIKRNMDALKMEHKDGIWE
jgi:uncharacterized protein (DUF3820 family)